MSSAVNIVIGDPLDTMGRSVGVVGLCLLDRDYEGVGVADLILHSERALHESQLLLGEALFAL